ncbi:MAG: hypothetical protein Q4P20_10695 [Eubacteriales bacterium]|nr:hypothetical protein [Eubacteriales bacterium]
MKFFDNYMKNVGEDAFQEMVLGMRMASGAHVTRTEFNNMLRAHRAEH